jgi:glycosyltransferase involved in cell wall biosynthesis
VHHVTLVVADGFGPEIYDGVRIEDLGKPAGRRERIFAKTLEGVRRLIGKFDLLHFHDSELIPAALWAKARGIKVVYDVHEDLPRDLRIKEWIPTTLRLPLSWSASAAEKIAGRAFDGIVTATPTIALRFPTSKTICIRNFPDTAEFQNIAGKPYQMRPEKFAYIGTLSHARGIVPLVEAADFTRATLVLGGKFNTPELEREVRKSRGWQSTEFIGFADRNMVADVLAEVRVGVCTLLPTQTHLDSYPVKLFEYLAVGLPVVLSDFPVWRSLLDGVDCAIFVDPSKPSSIAAAINELMNNPQQAEAMGRRGREAALTRFSWVSEEKRLIEFYDGLGPRTRFNSPPADA